MISDVITVSSSGKQTEAALAEVEKAAAYRGLAPKQALHLRLLAEEMMGMMRSITGETDGEFWLQDEGGVCEMHLRVKTLMDEEQRRQLIAASTSGGNEAARGFMGKLRSFFDPTACVPVFPDMFPGAPVSGAMNWSMVDYRALLDQGLARGDEGSQEAWDELEKSVVAHVADDVKVSIKGFTAEMTIVKKYA